jgi:hypothetical protein
MNFVVVVVSNPPNWLSYGQCAFLSFALSCVVPYRTLTVPEWREWREGRMTQIRQQQKLGLYLYIISYDRTVCREQNH